MNLKFILPCTLALTLFGCSTMGMGPKRPQFYPNDAYMRRGDYAAQQDSEYCMRLADEYIQEPSVYMEAAKSAAMGGAVGAGAGAVGGVIMKGSVGRATAAGAAAGAIIGLAQSLWNVNEKSPSYQRFVEHCLQKKGYEIVGWRGN